MRRNVYIAVAAAGCIAVLTVGGVFWCLAGGGVRERLSSDGPMGLTAKTPLVEIDENDKARAAALAAAPTSVEGGLTARSSGAGAGEDFLTGGAFGTGATGSEDGGPASRPNSGTTNRPGNSSTLPPETGGSGNAGGTGAGGPDNSGSAGDIGGSGDSGASGDAGDTGNQGGSQDRPGHQGGTGNQGNSGNQGGSGSNGGSGSQGGSGDQGGSGNQGGSGADRPDDSEPPANQDASWGPIV